VVPNGWLKRGANLKDANNWTNQQLAQASSLVGATLPDGTVMTEQDWEEFREGKTALKVKRPGVTSRPLLTIP
jgi:hypothetical protein